MTLKYSQYVIPGLSVCCLAGAVMVGTAMRTPMRVDVDIEDAAVYEEQVPEKLEIDHTIPTMETVVEKHLFVRERKATGANTFPDLLVKGVYVGEHKGAVFSLKSRPEINLRVWMDDIDGIISRISDPRDPRRSIIDFLNEWDIREITFKGVTVEHFVTGEVETYAVDYTPQKHVKDDASAGYGQGVLAESAQGDAKKTAKTTEKANQATSQAREAAQQRAQVMSQFRSMVDQMTPEQRARLAERIQNGDRSPGNTVPGNQTQKTQSGSKNSSRNAPARNNR